MKTYEETAQYILEVRNEHNKKIKRRKAMAMRIIPAIAGICSAVVICLAAVKNYRKPIDLITDENVITGGSISIVTTVPHGTEEAVTTLISTEKTFVQTTTKTTVSATSVTATKAAEPVEQNYAQTTYILTAAATSAVHTTVASTSYVTAATTAETVTTSVTTQEITTEPVIAGGWNWHGTGNGDWDQGGFGGFGGGESNEGGDWNHGGFGGFGGGGSYDDGETGSEYISEEQWQQLPINERYFYAYIYENNRVYTSLYMISSEYVGDPIYSADLISSQVIAGEQMQCVADVYSVNGITDESAVAIKFMENDEYYLYYEPNADLYKIIQTVPQA
ncbi:hypothetical protein [Ruminococcus sp.]|uniref:hypothetical protein n=1 Tax=Ruminococcus sp. TaxID=41978 RepID=UPI0025E65705|nr:hypothetical protein [Ruminococcus sp.]